MSKRIAPLTELAISKAKKAPKEYKLFDGGGLFLLVTSAGSKLWNFKYRFAGKEKKLALGAYPTITLADARQRREACRKLLVNGIDPGVARKQEKEELTRKVEHDTNTFEKVAREWHTQKKVDWSANHGERLLKSLERDVLPHIGVMPIANIKTPELAELLQRISIRTNETAHRIKIAISMIFQYAILKGLIESNPATSLKGVLPSRKHKHMAAPTEPIAVAELMRAIDVFNGTFIVKCALQLTPLLFVRPGELRKMEWADVDLEAGEWRYLVTKTKTNHLVPLPRQAIAILKSVHPFTGHSKYVFQSLRSPQVCMSENTVNAALRRLGFTGDEIVAHGFRAMARTMLHEVLGFQPDAIEAQLAHKVPDRLGSAYNRTKFLAERRKMMQAWADYLDDLKNG